MIPLQVIEGVPVMDVETILKRHPGVCLVDGLAYDNPPGSPNPSRWQDVEQLLDAGISVISSINIQYIDDLRERVARITGKHVSQTVPRAFFTQPTRLWWWMRLRRCASRAPKTAEADARASSQAQKLSELREIALLLAADVVDRQLKHTCTAWHDPDLRRAGKQCWFASRRGPTGLHDRQRQAQRRPFPWRLDGGLRTANRDLARR